jgi:hypothetical protein
MKSETKMTSSPEKLQAFLDKAVGDFGAAVSSVLMLIGDELGLYREPAKGKLTPAELAQRTGTNGRYVKLERGGRGAAAVLQSGANKYTG